MRVRAALWLFALPLKTIQIKRKSQCAACGSGTKSMTGKRAEGSAWGTGKIRLGRRSWLILPVGAYHYIQIYRLLITQYKLLINKYGKNINY
jgi:hypothetical protein